MKIVVVGLGYVGMPLVVEAVRVGHIVTGVDLNDEVVRNLNAGRSHVDDLTDEEIRSAVDHGFQATVNFAEVRSADAVLICVPTPLSTEGGPDLSAVIGAARSIGKHVSAGTLVVLESTTYPGTTDEVVAPILEETSGERVGDGIFLAYSPERIDPGNKKYQLRNTPKVVGGMTPACTERARELYASLVDDVVLAQGTREAESAKLLENTYRHVNIALVNEMAKFFHELEIDFWDVQRLAATKPFGFQAFSPGPGVGGHCIPIDPNYLSHRVRSKLGYAFRFVELAQEINATMPAYVAQRAQDLLNDAGKPVRNSTVLLLGVTYKPDIADQRESPADELARQLMSLGAHLQYNDPFVEKWRDDVPRVDDPYGAAASADLTILLQPHGTYDVDRLEAQAQRLFDTRGRTSQPGSHRL